MYWKLLFVSWLMAIPRIAGADPTVDEVVDRTLHHAGIEGDVDRWSTRSRLRNLMPRLSGTLGGWDEVDRDSGVTEYLTSDADGALLFDTARTDSGNGEKQRIFWSLRATVDFGGLVFDSAEIAASREARARVLLRVRLVDEATRTYFAWLEAGEDVATKRRSRARLDGLTGGWFSRALDEGGER